ncbi:MAG: response regulator [Phycisphaeraceae bacterium]|nr:response regulator [Phycisphaeraceae bacterium]
MAEPAGKGRSNTLGLSGKALERLLGDLDGGCEASDTGRQFVRWSFRNETIHAKFRQPGGAEMVVRVACRNISKGGMAVLHSAYLHPGSACAVVLPHLIDGPTVVSGVVVRCQHRRGVVHEIGIKFNRPIEVRDFISADPFSDSFNLERVDPQSLEGCVLLVEDSDLDAGLLMHYMRETRLRIRRAVSAEEGLALASEGCDLVLLGAGLAEQEGAELVATLRDREHASTVIAIASDGSETTRARVSGVQANVYLTKPVSQETLMRALGEFLIASGPARVAPPPSPDHGAQMLRRFASDAGKHAKRLEDCVECDDKNECREICMQLFDIAKSTGFERLSRMAFTAAEALTASSSVSEALTEVRAVIENCRRVQAA